MSELVEVWGKLLTTEQGSCFAPIMRVFNPLGQIPLNQIVVGIYVLSYGQDRAYGMDQEDFLKSMHLKRQYFLWLNRCCQKGV
jgi:hypothetical protein